MIKKLVSASLVLFLIGSVALAQTDQIQLIDKSIKRVKITKITETTIYTEDRSVEENFPVNTIRCIKFNREPVQFDKARNLIETDSNEDAILLLTPDVRETLGKEAHLNLEMDYLIARAKANIALSNGDVTKQEAAKLCEAFIKKAPTSYHYFDLCELTGDLLLAINTKESIEKASEYYMKLNKAPWEDMKMRSMVAIGKIFLAQNNPAKAQRAYEAVLKLQDKSEMANRMRLIAKMGLAKCLALTGNTGKAVEDVKKILQDAQPEDSMVNALGYNTLGMAYMAANQDKDAVVAFLQVDLLYSRDVQSHIEALKNLRTLWKKMSMQNRAQECTEKLRAYGVID